MAMFGNVCYFKFDDFVVNPYNEINDFVVNPCFKINDFVRGSKCPLSVKFIQNYSIGKKNL